jgi:adenylate kinase
MLYKLSPTDDCLRSTFHISMDLVLLGAPGSGKGTQAGHLRRELGLTHIASGDLFRDHLQRKTDLGVRASESPSTDHQVPNTPSRTSQRHSVRSATNGSMLVARRAGT